MGLWELDPEVVHDTLNEWLAEPSGDYCSCGRELPVYATGCGLCPTCRKAKEDAEQLDACAREKIRHQEEIGVPPAYRHCELSTFQGETPTSLLDWVIRPEGFLTLHGADTGVGKTHLATAALRSLASGGHRCWWISAIELARRLSLEEFDPEQPTFHKSSRVEILLIDDLGSENKAVVNGSERVDALLDERYRFHKKTIVTTNLTPAQLFERNARIASRLSEGTVIERNGRDRRGAK